VVIDAEKAVATIGAGASWQPVIAAAAQHGLAPIAGSSPSVGVVGYLLGGGLGPLARSHGFSSDYLVRLTLVTGTGVTLTASETENPEVFWALRGGKGRLGILTELELRLVPLPALYAGSLTFDTPHMETAFRSWVDWTKTADPRVTTSVAFIRFPALDAIPGPLRGRHLMSLRFAYPGGAADGERLAAPLRAFASVYLDALAEMPAADVARIHNDPTEPAPVFVRGMLLEPIDQNFATALLGHAGAGRESPIGVVEVRQLGEATRKDVAAGSAVGGRRAAFALSLIGRNPAWFDKVLPDATDQLTEKIRGWVSAETNINYLGKARSPEHLASAWPRETYEKLRRIREKYDPLGLIGDLH
jgi:FAD/FMN-containing dehydrogenase